MAANMLRGKAWIHSLYYMKSTFTFTAGWLKELIIGKRSLYIHDCMQFFFYTSMLVDSRPPSEVNEEGLPPGSEGGAEPRPSTPPPRPEAFEQFKKERGSEINKIFVANKGR